MSVHNTKDRTRAQLTNELYRTTRRAGETAAATTALKKRIAELRYGSVLSRAGR
jgi:hypothetical protein